MAETYAITKPERWDLPFSHDLADPDERRDMTYADIDRLLSMEPFKHMDPTKFPRELPLRDILRFDTRLRYYQDCDVVVAEGDYGNSAFVVVGGSALALNALNPKLIGRGVKRKRSWLRSLLQPLCNSRSPEIRDSCEYAKVKQAKRAARSDGAIFFVKDVINLKREVDDGRVRMEGTAYGPGMLFGEVAAIARTPRRKTVLAHGGAELLEIRWQGLRDLRKHDPKLREDMDKSLRQYGLSQTLGSSRLLKGLGKDELQRVLATAEFETYGTYDWFGSFRQLRRKQADPIDKEPVIAREGDYANGLILISAGFARLSRRHGSAEQTFSYLSQGDDYGLDELVHNARGQETVALQATLRAIGYVDVVRIPAPTFEEYIRPRLPAGAAREIPTPPKRAEPVTSVALPVVPSRPPRTSPARAPAAALDPGFMEFLVEHRLINGKHAMLIDTDKCTRCDDCVRACASGHNNNPVFVRHGPVHGHYMVANACMHCVDPVCLIGCPTGAIRREKSGQVVIDDNTCVGCQTCAASCPYDNIRMVDVRDKQTGDRVMIDKDEPTKAFLKATKCDLCIDHHGGPACERACPHDALKRVDLSDPEALAEWMNR